jgi:hypothetical protein
MYASPEPTPDMTERCVTFSHDGHRFDAIEHASVAGAAPASYHWEVTMDGAPALEFTGEYPYRDPDVHKRVLEWYGIQKPRA